MTTHSRTTDARDPKSFRVPSYPTLAPFFVAGFLLLLQVGLFAIGGVSFFGNRINSLFAIGEDEVEISLSQSAYNSDEVEYVNGELRLKEQDLNDLGSEDQQDQSDQSDQLDQLDQIESENQEEEIENGESEIGENNETIEQYDNRLTVNSEQLTGSNETDGVNEEPQVDQLDHLDHLDQQTQYTSEAQISFTQEIEYSKLVRILELSSINDFNSSVELSAMSNEPTALNSQLTAHITYQLSPNNTDWYYYSATEARWEKTTNGYVSSNSVQEINTHIESFDPEVGEEKSLFIRAYLHSDGETQVILKRLVVVRELQLITNTRDQLDQIDSETTELSEFTVKEPESLTFLKPVVLNAAYANGNKIISGRVELDEGVVIPDAELPNYSVTIYYTPDRDITTPAKDVDEEIGRADLQQITVNNETQYVFELKVPSTPGGYVTGQVCYGQCALGDELNAQRSQLSAPTENATLTVTETGDQSDATPGDGSCDHDGVTPGSQCTLRAAIEEANALAGADNIYFNIPDTDGNYFDYDNQTPGSNSGDGVGGDDFWSIQPASALPDVTEETTLDGTTQTTNQGDHNTEGPEIEIDGGSAGSVHGITFSTGSNFSELFGTVINNFSSNNFAAIFIEENNILIDDNYIGTDIKGESANGNSYGILGDPGVSYIIIINNIISGNSFAIGLTDSEYVFASSNIIGLNKSQTAAIPNALGFFYANTSTTDKTSIIIGGDLPSDGNVFAGNSLASLWYSGIDAMKPSSILNSKIKNNTFGTNQSKTIDFTTNEHIRIRTGPQAWNNQIFEMEISNNVIRNGSWVGIFAENVKHMEIINNELSNNNIYIQYNEEDTWFADTPKMSPGNGPFADSEVLIQNNLIENTNTGINIIGSSPVIQGNLIRDNSGYGFAMDNYQSSKLAALSPTNISYHYLYSRPQIGGTAALTGSRCNGIEANCFSGNAEGEILMTNSAAWNEATLATDNVFQNVSGNRIELQWRGLYELFSNDVRRTDITEEELRFNLPSNVRDDTTGKNFQVSCENATVCPNQGVANSTGNTAIIAPNASVGLGGIWAWYQVFEYIVDGSGAYIDHSSTDFDQYHLASQEFSFDGNSTSEPINTGSARVITIGDVTQTFNDRGEPWTDTVDADRDIQDVTPNGLGWYEYPLGSFQIMEVELVDANPVLQEDGTYVITVDSTTNEDNVSTSGYDDGGGAYSGGGNEGPDGLPNGSTSLLEAIYVANQHAGTDYIHFDIPVDDPSHVCYEDDGVSGQVTTGNIVTTTTKDDPACGGTQIDPDHPYSWFDLSTTGTHTLTGPTIIDGYTQDGASKNTAAMGETLNHIIKIDTGDTIFELDGGNSEITGIALTDGEAAIYMDSDNNHIHGIYMGVDPSGLNPTGQNHKIRVRGANNTIGSNLNGANDTNEFNLINAATATCQSTWNHVDSKLIDMGSLLAQDLQVNRNYFNVNRNLEAPDPMFRAQSTINWGGTGSFAGIIDGLVVKDNIIANSTVGLGSAHQPYTIYFDIENNRINTDMDGNKTLNTNMCDGAPIILKLTGGITKNSTTANTYGGILRNNIIHTTAPNDSYWHYALILYFSSDSIIENNTFSGSVNFGGFDPHSPTFFADNVTVRNNTIRDTWDTGLSIYAYTDSIFESNKIENTCQYSSGAGLLINTFYPINDNLFNNNTIGTSDSQSNCSSAIILRSGSTNGNTLRDNILYSTDQTVIDIEEGTEDSYGVTENDISDSDTGANDVQNFPIINTVEYLGAGQYRISGDLDENSSEAPFDIEICESYNHPSNHGGCIQTLGHVTANSPWQTIVTVTGSDGTDGRIFSTLATNSNGSTSEFSENFTADTSNPDFSVITYEIELVYPINGIQIDDRTPQLDWNPAVETATGYLDPDIHHYEVYIDGVYYESTIDSTTELQLNSPLSLGSHTWEVVAFRQLGDGSFVETARSTVESFEIINPNYSFEPIYPVDVTIDDTTPLFDWTDLDPSSDFDSYDLYIDGELVQEGIVTSEHQLAQSSQLTADTHTWYVTAMRLEPDGSRTEVGRTDTAEFEIFIPVEPPVTGQESEDKREPEDDDRQSSIFNRIVPILPITGVLTIGFISMLAFGFAGSLNDLFLNLGFLIGIVYRRKKKYWGIVFDEQSSEPIPFAIIRLFKDGRLVKQTVSDLEGRYALIAEENGTYTIESKANGYQPYTKDISYNDAVDVVEDIPLLKTDQKVFFLKRYLNHNKSNAIRYIKYGLVGLMVLGFFYTLYVTFRSPHIINFILLGIYALLFFLNALEILRYLSRKSGRVEEIKSKKGVGGVSVRIYQAGKQLDVVLSNVKGVIKFNLKPGIYRFMAHKSGYEQVKGKDSTEQRERGRGVKLELDKKGTLSSSIKMRQMTKNKEQRSDDSEQEVTPFRTI